MNDRLRDRTYVKGTMACWSQIGGWLLGGSRESTRKNFDVKRETAAGGPPESPHYVSDSTRHGNPKGHQSGQQRPPRVLVVDDDPDTRLVLCDLLEKHGYECQTAENGMNAVEELIAIPIDVVITDYQMPVMNGLELIEWVARASRKKYPPVILLTGDLHESVRERATKGGVYSILPKPFRIDDLLSTLEKAKGS